MFIANSKLLNAILIRFWHTKCNSVLACKERLIVDEIRVGSGSQSEDAKECKNAGTNKKAESGNLDR